MRAVSEVEAASDGRLVDVHGVGVLKAGVSEDHTTHIHIHGETGKVTEIKGKLSHNC